MSTKKRSPRKKATPRPRDKWSFAKSRPLRPDWLPPVEMIPADRLGEFPSVWLIAGRDAEQQGLGVAWEFDVKLLWRDLTTRFVVSTTLCIGASRAASQTVAIEMLRKRAHVLGYAKVDIYEIRPPLTAEKRRFIQEVNYAIRRPDYRLGKVAI